MPQTDVRPRAGASSSTAGVVAKADDAPTLTRGAILLMATATGLFVAAIYYNQPILGILAEAFGTGADGISMVPVATQVGYAAGLLFLASLGDRFERRGLIVLTAAALAASLAASALAPGLGLLTLASLATGALATVAQQVVPMAAHLAPEDKRGQVVGTVMAGLLTGILLARTVSGFLSEFLGWRAMFGLAAGATLLMGGVLAARLPRVPPTSRLSYARTLGSMAALLRDHPTLRRAGMVQALLFGSFVAFWANVALFLEQPPFSQGAAVAGLLGLLGAAGVLAAPTAGRLADRAGRRGRGKDDGKAKSNRLVVAGAGAVAVAFALFGLFPASWTALLGGIVLMDVGLQAAMISNQSRVYALDAAARSRLNTVYMTIMFTGGALGAAAGAQAFARWGWPGLCAMGAAAAALALVLEAAPRGRPRRQE
ncbi:MAG: MFS transporter [Desulfovibrionaceae bacterium]|jgi:predicted MFS family arabinose efflux permease|nr:MFS transporter [Desulfovibrionaceae bacterium]